MDRPIARFVALSLTGVTLGCGADGPERVAPLERDSAGVRIVESTEPAWSEGEGWRLSAEPVLEIGAVSGEPAYEFAAAHGPVRLSDGRIAVADSRLNEIRFFDAQGRHLRSVGRTGGGPGEFSQLYRMRKIAGDSLMALNPITRTSIFSPSGEYIRTFELEFVPGRTNIWWLGRLDDNTLLAFSLAREGTAERTLPANAPPNMEAGFYIPEKPEFYRDSLMHYLYTMQGELIDSIGKWPGQWLGENRIYPPNAAYAFEGVRFHHSPGDIVEIRTYRSLVGERATMRGASEAPRELIRLERIVRRLPAAGEPITEEFKEQYREDERARYRRMMETNPGMFDMPSVERRLGELNFPPALPAHGNRMFADAVGNLWLQEYRIGTDEPYRWSVFDPEGFWLGMVETPAQFTVNEIGSDYVLGIWRGELDVQTVRMYRLEK